MSDINKRVARAVSLNLKSQWEGQEIVKELNDPTSWSAEGGEIDLTKLAQAAIDEMEACGYVKLDDLIEKAEKEFSSSGLFVGQQIPLWLKAQKG